VFGTELACVHYLFKQNHGGTAFYRHRRTGFEVVTQERKAEYFRKELSLSGTSAAYPSVSVQVTDGGNTSAMATASRKLRYWR